MYYSIMLLKNDLKSWVLQRLLNAANISASISKVCYCQLIAQGNGFWKVVTLFLWVKSHSPVRYESSVKLKQMPKFVMRRIPRNMWCLAETWLWKPPKTFIYELGVCWLCLLNKLKWKQQHVNSRDIWVGREDLFFVLLLQSWIPLERALPWKQEKNIVPKS